MILFYSLNTPSGEHKVQIHGRAKSDMQISRVFFCLLMHANEGQFVSPWGRWRDRLRPDHRGWEVGPVLARSLETALWSTAAGRVRSEFPFIFHLFISRSLPPRPRCLCVVMRVWIYGWWLLLLHAFTGGFLWMCAIYERWCCACLHWHAVCLESLFRTTEQGCLFQLFQVALMLVHHKLMFSPYQKTCTTYSWFISYFIKQRI